MDARRVRVPHGIFEHGVLRVALSPVALRARARRTGKELDVAKGDRRNSLKMRRRKNRRKKKERTARKRAAAASEREQAKSGS